MLWPASPATAQHVFHDFRVIALRLFHIPVARFEVKAEFSKVFRFEPRDLQFDRHYAIASLRLLDLAAHGLANLPV